MAKKKLFEQKKRGKAMSTKPILSHQCKPGFLLVALLRGIAETDNAPIQQYIDGYEVYSTVAKLTTNDGGHLVVPLQYLYYIENEKTETREVSVSPDNDNGVPLVIPISQIPDNVPAEIIQMMKQKGV